MDILSPMKFVAFHRNVNLGQPKSPTRSQLEAAFLQAGASEAASFMSNGTLVFSVARSRVAPRTAQQAREILSRVCGLTQPVFVQSFPYLAQLVAEYPFVKFTDPDIVERCISFFEPKATAQLEPPLESERKDCLVFRATAGLALSIVREVNGKIGYPTPVLERELNLPVTTRGWTTIVRLVERYG
jgi:uncharacterized protein (DUF1697 family)